METSQVIESDLFSTRQYEYHRPSIHKSLNYPTVVSVDDLVGIYTIPYQPSKYFIITDKDRKCYQIRFSTVLKAFKLGISEFRVVFKRTWYHLEI